MASIAPAFAARKSATEAVAGFSLHVEPSFWKARCSALQISVLAMIGRQSRSAWPALDAPLASPRHSAARPGFFTFWFVRGTPQLLQLVFLYDALPPSASMLEIHDRGFSALP